MLAASLPIMFLAATAQRAGDEPPTANAAYQKTAKSNLQSGNFELLEQTGKNLRTSKAKFVDGLWKLKSFYDGLSPMHFARTDSDWKEFSDKMQAWKEAFPESITRPVVEAQGLIQYAWKARGLGNADTITPEGGQLLDERILQARRILEEAEKLPQRCPGWYKEMLTVAYAQGWDETEAKALFERAVKAEPTYYSFYSERATYLMPRWHGHPGDLEKFADEAGSEYDPAEGDTMCARVVWGQLVYYKNIFKETDFKWDRVKKGFLDMEKVYPGSVWNLNKFCRMAWLAGDKATAHALFQKMGDRVEPTAWKSMGELEVARTACKPATP